jgi:hypothetical protein
LTKPSLQKAGLLGGPLLHPAWQDEDSEESESGAKSEPPIRLSPEGFLWAFFDDFPPLDPWEARASEVHAAWRAGLLVAPFASFLLIAIGVIVADWRHSTVPSVLKATLVAIAVLGLALASRILRERLRAIDPARRRRRWTAWKQVNDDLQRAAHPPKPKPPVRGRKFWMRRLAERLARLDRLVALDAPEGIVASSRKLVHDAIAELEKGDAEAVLAAWPEAVKHLEPRGASSAEKKGKRRERPN